MEAALIAAAEKVGPWFFTIVLTIYILSNKLGPTLITDWQARRKAELARSESDRKAALAAEHEERESIERVYERLLEREDQRTKEMMALQKETVAFVTAATEAVHGLTRAVDGMERQVYQLSQQIKQQKAG